MPTSALPVSTSHLSQSVTPTTLTTRMTTAATSTTALATTTTKAAALPRLPAVPPPRAPMAPASLPSRPPMAPGSQARVRPPAPAPAPRPAAVLTTNAPLAMPVLQKRGMSYDRMSNIEVIWGLNPDSARDDPANLFNVDFDLRSMAAQEFIVKTCERATAQKSLKVWRAFCWPSQFANYLVEHGGEFPSATYEADLQRYYNMDSLTHDHMGWSEDRRFPTWVSLTFRVEFDSHSGGYQTKPYMEAWQKFIADENKRADDLGITSLGPAILNGDIFVRAEAESRVIDSALSSWLVSVVCALAAVVAFTRNLFLSATATFAIFATAACSLFTITSVFKWHFGLMEAVSLIIFCGFSVDYPLHVVQAYVQERRAGAGVRQALHEVGFAIASGCFTTVGAAAFLLMCEIRIFRRFGLVLMANMLFSLVFALLWIPPLLELRELMPCRSRSRLKESSAVASSSYLAPDPRTPSMHLDSRSLPPEGFEAL